MKAENQKNKEILDYENIVAKLKTMPEQQYPDISEKVMASIKRENVISQQRFKRLIYSAIGISAAVLAICVGLGYYMSNPSDKGAIALSGAVSFAQPRGVESSLATPSIYDAIELLQKFEAGEISALDSRFAAFVDLFIKGQKENGFLGDVLSGGERTYNHSMSVLILVKLYESGNYPELFTPLDAALGYIRDNQTERGSWGEDYSGSSQIGILNVAALGIAQNLGWSDMSGHLRRGLRCLEYSTNSRLREASTIAEKLAIVQELGKIIYCSYSS